MKRFLLLSIVFLMSFFIPAAAQSYYLGKTISFIKQEKGEPVKTEDKDGETIYVYKKVSQKGTESLIMYYFNASSKCTAIVQTFEMWFLIPWAEQLSEKYKRLDKSNWLEKDNIIHAVNVINEDKFIYIIKYKD